MSTRDARQSLGTLTPKPFTLDDDTSMDMCAAAAARSCGSNWRGGGVG